MKLLSASFIAVLFFVSNVLAAGAPKADQKCEEPKEGAATCADKADHGHSYAEKKAHHAKVLNSLFPEKTADKSLSQIPSAPILTAPSFLSTVEKTVSLKWTETYPSDNYHLQIATDPNFKWLVVNEKFVSGLSYQFTAAEAGKKYYWRVAGHSATNIAGYSKSNFVSSVFIVK